MYKGTYAEGLRELADIHESVAAELRGLANHPEQLAEYQKSDFYLRLARELRKLRTNAAGTEHLVNNMAMEAMSDELMRK